MTDYIEAHKFCTRNGGKLKEDKICGCFYCLSVFSPSEIKEWINERPAQSEPSIVGEAIDDGHKTALCPYCGIDSVIGESSGYPITKEFLEKMKDYWFKEN